MHHAEVFGLSFCDGVPEVSPQVWGCHSEWRDHLGAVEEAGDVSVKRAQRHGHIVKGEGVQMIEPLVFLVRDRLSCQHARAVTMRKILGCGQVSVKINT